MLPRSPATAPDTATRTAPRRPGSTPARSPRWWHAVTAPRRSPSSSPRAGSTPSRRPDQPDWGEFSGARRWRVLVVFFQTPGFPDGEAKQLGHRRAIEGGGVALRDVPEHFALAPRD